MLSGSEAHQSRLMRFTLFSTSYGPVSVEPNSLGIKAANITARSIRIKRIDLPDEVSRSVFRRMEAERERVAREFRSLGAELAEQISAQADKEREIILANAYREAEQIRGRGDAKSAEIYARSHGENEEFYAFQRSVNAYQKSFENAQDALLLEPKSDFFRYFSKEE